MILIAFLVLAPLQDEKTPDQKEVNKAIEAGADFLLKHLDQDPGNAAFRGDELALYALLHAGRKEDPRFDALLKRVLQLPLDAPAYPVYNVSLRAMLLARLDPVQYQQEIARCAWWLVNAQTENGQWDYYGPQGPAPDHFQETPWTGAIATGGKGRIKNGLKVERIEKWGPAPARSEGRILRNSSTMQYALLGLHAAYRSRVLIPMETWKKALESLLNSQAASGGWGYIDPKDKENGWQPGNHTYASMTASNLSALAVLDDILQIRDARSQKAVDAGFDYLSKNLQLRKDQISREPGMLDHLYHYYGMFSVERAGILWQREIIGKTSWYAVGANDLLKTQEKNGSWGMDHPGGTTDRMVNASFAILFLRRAVPPLIRTGDDRKRGEPPPIKTENAKPR